MTDTDSLKAALEPCPFCGDTDIREDHPNRAPAVYCFNCRASSSGPEMWNLRASTDAAPAATGNPVKITNWLRVAGLAGEHGVRYRTNAALEKFLTAVLPFAHPPVPDAAGEGEAAKLADLIRTRLLGVDPDDQDLQLEDDDWLLILTALAQPPAAEPASAAVANVTVSHGPCQHRWAHAPTAGYYQCIDCHECHAYGSDMYRQIEASFATGNGGEGRS